MADLFGNDGPPAGSRLYQHEQRVKLFEDYPGQEREIKNEILTDLARRRKHYLAIIRHNLEDMYALKYLAGVENLRCISDDAHLICEAIPDIPDEDTMCRAFLGSTFKDAPEWWTDDTFEPSTWKGNHGRLQRRWFLHEEPLKAAIVRVQVAPAKLPFVSEADIRDG